MIAAVDFDGTLVKNMYPKIGAINRPVFDRVKQMQAEGATLILWTCRTGDLLDEAVSFCKANGLIFDYINENTPDSIKKFGGDTRKIYADVYVDDRDSDFAQKAERNNNIMKEVRTALITVENRAEAAAGAMFLIGRPVVYDTPATISTPSGAYTEIIKRGALDGADLTDVRLLYDHSTSARVPLARTPKTLQFSISPAGLEMKAALSDSPDAKSIYTAVSRGDVDGMSFAFTVPAGGDCWDRKSKTREITKISKVYEVSICPFPAYPTASVEARAALRDIDDRQSAIIKCNLILSKHRRIKI